MSNAQMIFDLVSQATVQTLLMVLFSTIRSEEHTSELQSR